MIELHHLNHSRSQRVLWLLEELEVPYKVVGYERDPVTSLAPPELRRIHPLGKSPVIRDGELVLAESGAIVEYLAVTYGDGRLSRRPGSPDWTRYLHWMHFAEGSAMLPLLLKLYTGRLGDAAAPLAPRINGEIGSHLTYMNAALTDAPWFLGQAFSAADIQMSFPVEAASAGPGFAQAFPALADFLSRIQSRPAYRRAIGAGGPYRFDRGA